MKNTGKMANILVEDRKSQLVFAAILDQKRDTLRTPVADYTAWSPL